MIVTNKQIQDGKFDTAILEQIKALCENWVIRYSNSYGNDKDTKPFHLGFRLKDKDNYV